MFGSDKLKPIFSAGQSNVGGLQLSIVKGHLCLQNSSDDLCEETTYRYTHIQSAVMSGRNTQCDKVGRMLS